jgi:plasmid replication initiation protein
MKNFLASILEKMLEWLKAPSQQGGILELEKQEIYFPPPQKPLENPENENPQNLALEEEKTSNVSQEPPLKIKEARAKVTKKGKNPVVPYVEIPGRDLMDMMEVPFLALSKNRKSPILYESKDGTRKVKVSRHTGHYLASIYDWDIVLFVASKMQRILNEMSDIPPRTMIVPRHELLKAIHRTNGKKTDKDLESSLSRLQLTGIETTIRNEDYKYKAGFGFLDSWGYTKRKDVKEISITLSQWLYDGICAKGSLLKVEPSYFDLTSGLKRFLYRTARKHAGQNKDGWDFSIESLYEKSGSEREFKKFKSDLLAAVIKNNIPDYTMQLIQKNNKSFILFKPKSNIEKIEQLIDNVEAH